MTDADLAALRSNALQNDGQVEKWLDLKRSLALIDEVIALRAALAEALDMLDRRYQEDPSTRDREEARIAALREKHLGKK